MDSISEIGSSSPLDSALYGLELASAEMQDGAEEVLTTTTQSVDGEGISSSAVGITDVVRISDAARSVQDGTLSLESGLANTRSGAVTYSANAAVIKNTEEQFASMVDMVLAGSKLTR
ncbi:MAG: hypothetical protein P8R54_32640 [Myxococcota bacterium]|nr:hypothetical protein [Myxococcota bacterium]